jgi:hypothetical protein
VTSTVIPHAEKAVKRPGKKKHEKGQVFLKKDRKGGAACYYAVRFETGGAVFNTNIMLFSYFSRIPPILPRPTKAKRQVNAIYTGIPIYGGYVMRKPRLTSASRCSSCVGRDTCFQRGAFLPPRRGSVFRQRAERNLLCLFRARFWVGVVCQMPQCGVLKQPRRLKNQIPPVKPGFTHWN